MRRLSPICRVRLSACLPLAAFILIAQMTCAQETPAAAAPALAPAPETAARPIAIVSLDRKNPDQAAKVTGALEVSQGSAVIVGSGSITSGAETTKVELPYRGVLRVCASTTVKLASDSSAPSTEVPGLMMAMDHGAIEASLSLIHIRCV